MKPPSDEVYFNAPGSEAEEGHRAEEEQATVQAEDGRTLIANLPGMAYRCLNDEAWTLEFASAGCRDLTGYEPCALVGNKEIRYADLIHKEDRDEVWQSVQKALASNSAFTLNYRIRTATGQQKWVLEKGYKVPGSQRVLTTLEGFITDITPQKRVEQALRESEEKLSRIFHSSPELIAVMDLESGRYLQLSDSYTRLLGYSREEVLGRSSAELQIWNDPEGHERLLESLGRQGEVRNLEVSLRRKTGEVFPALVSAVPVVLDGVRCCVKVIVDITAQKQAEEALRASTERFRALFENAPIGIYRSTPDGRITVANPRLLELLGCESFEVLSARNLEAEGFATDSPRDSFKSAIERDGEVRGMESGWTRADGSIVWLRENAWAVRGEDGDILFYEGMVEDLTERRQADEERRKLEAINLQTTKLESLGLLAGGIAHDFNNILTGIFGLTQLAIDESPPEGQLRQDLQQLLEIGQRAKKLVQQILFFSRKRDVEHQPMRVGPVVEEAMNLLRASLPTTIEMRASIRTDRDVILADPTQIQQVVLNLCTNAAYAMREKGGLLEVSIDRVQDATGLATHGPKIGPGPCLVLSVRDTGSGMPPEVMKRLFEPFFTTKPIGEGTGLGLPVIYGVVTATGGAIRVDSEPGRGSTFEIFLPLTDDEPDTASSQTFSARTSEGETILLVDDEEAILDAHSRILQRMGYEVVPCKDGVQALEVFSCDPDRFDLVLTDQTMPRLTGDKLSRQLLKTRPDLPIVLCTGYSDTITAEQSREQGIKAFLLKPVEVEELAAAIRKAVRKNGNGMNRAR